MYKAQTKSLHNALLECAVSTEKLNGGYSNLGRTLKVQYLNLPVGVTNLQQTLTGVKAITLNNVH